MENDLIKNIILLIVCNFVLFLVYILPSQKTTSTYKKNLLLLLSFVINSIILHNFTDIDGMIFVGAGFVLISWVLQLIVKYLKKKYKIK